MFPFPYATYDQGVEKQKRKLRHYAFLISVTIIKILQFFNLKKREFI